MTVLEGTFLFLCVYVIVDLPIMLLNALRGKDMRGRVIVWLVALVAAVVLGLFVLADEGHVLR